MSTERTVLQQEDHDYLIREFSAARVRQEVIGDRLIRIEIHLEGNGQPGLLQRMTRQEEWRLNLESPGRIGRLSNDVAKLAGFGAGLGAAITVATLLFKLFLP